MRQEPIRVVLLGAGRVAQHYKKILDSGVVSGYKIAGVADAKPEAAKALADHFGCPAYPTVEAALDKAGGELILVLTPSGLHHAHAKAALERRLHVLVEKPISMRPEEARELDALARKQGVMCGVAFQNRLNPAIIHLREALKAGRFGKITTATMRLRWCRTQDYYEDGWHGTWANDGGVINQQAIHHVDALNWLMPVESVSAAIGNRLNKLEAEDTLIAAVRFTDGALGTLEATTAARPKDFEASLSIVGEKGYAVVGGIALNKIEAWSFVEPRPEDARAAAEHSREVPNGYGLSHGPLLQATLDALRKGTTEAVVSAADAIKTAEVIHALYRSDELKGWAKPGETSDRLGRVPARSR